MKKADGSPVVIGAGPPVVDLVVLVSETFLETAEGAKGGMVPVLPQQ